MNPPQNSQNPQNPPPPDAQPFTILVADDDAGDRMLAAEAMEEAQVLSPVRFMQDGEELMKYLQHRAGGRDGRDAAPFRGLILLDLNMPRKDGREVLAEMKADPGLRDIPVVVLTTSQAEEDRAQARALGAAGFISKPVTFDGMVQVLKTLEQFGVEFAVECGAPDKPLQNGSFQDGSFQDGSSQDETLHE